MIHIEVNNIKQIESNLQTVLSLEYYGIHIEDTKEQDFKLIYCFSVPERSTIDISNALNDKIKTASGLIEIAKDVIAQMIIDSCKTESEDDEDVEFYHDVKNNISKYASFYAKVRKGEVWNEEMGRVAIQKITDEIKNNSYKQV